MNKTKTKEGIKQHPKTNTVSISSIRLHFFPPISSKTLTPSQHSPFFPKHQKAHKFIDDQAKEVTDGYNSDLETKLLESPVVPTKTDTNEDSTQPTQVTPARASPAAFDLTTAIDAAPASLQTNPNETPHDDDDDDFDIHDMDDEVPATDGTGTTPTKKPILQYNNEVCTDEHEYKKIITDNGQTIWPTRVVSTEVLSDDWLLRTKNPRDMTKGPNDWAVRMCVNNEQLNEKVRLQCKFHRLAMCCTPSDPTKALMDNRGNPDRVPPINEYPRYAALRMVNKGHRISGETVVTMGVEWAKVLTIGGSNKYPNHVCYSGELKPHTRLPASEYITFAEVFKLMLAKENKGKKACDKMGIDRMLGNPSIRSLYISDRHLAKALAYRKSVKERLRANRSDDAKIRNWFG